MSNFKLKLRIPLAWYSPDPMHATKSRFEVPNRRFKGIWNLIFSKQGWIWGQNFDLLKQRYRSLPAPGDIT